MKAIIKPIVALALVWVMPAAAAPATESEEGWRLRINGYWVDTNEVRVDQRATGHRSQVENSAAAGGGINGEYRFSPRLGIELGLLGGAETDYSVGFEQGSVVATNTMAFDAAYVGLNVHLTPGKKADLYAGPLVAYVTYSDIFVGVAGAPFRSPEILVPVSVRFDDEIALGINLGVDVPISQHHWFFNANAKYLAASPDTNLEATGVFALRDSASIDPLMVGVGFGYRF